MVEASSGTVQSRTARWAVAAVSPHPGDPELVRRFVALGDGTALGALALAKLKVAASVTMALSLAVSGATVAAMQLAGESHEVISAKEEKKQAVPALDIAETFVPPPTPLLKPIDEQVLALAFSPDGKRLVTAGARHVHPGQIKIWDVASRKELAKVRGIRGTRTVAISPDGKTLACGEFGGNITLRDAATGEERAVLKGHSVGVNSLAFSADGTLLVSAGLDRIVKLWDTRTLTERKIFRGHTGMIFTVAFFSHGKAFVTAGADKTARIWDVADGKAKFILEGHRYAVEAVAVSPDDKTVATASWDNTVKFWDAATGNETAVLEGHQAPVYAVAYSRDGKLLTTSAADGSVRLWDALTHKLLVFLGNHASAAWSVAFSHDGKLLASGSSDKTAKLWDVVAGKELATLATSEFKSVRAVAYAPDGKEVAIATDEKTVQVLDAITGDVRQILSGHADIVNCLAFAADGKTLAGASYDRTIRLWDRATGKTKRVLEGHSGDIYALAFNQEGKLASASEDKTVKVWNPESGEELANFKGHAGPVRAVAFAPDGMSLASGSADKTIRLWYLDKTPPITLNGHDGAICALAFSGARLASAGADGSVKVWQTAPGKIWKPAQAKVLTLKGHSGEVTALAFLRGGRTLVSGGQDTNVIVWDAVNGDLRQVLRGHTEPVTAVAIHPHGQNLLSGSLDTTVLRWQNSRAPAAALTGLVPASPNKPKPVPQVNTAPAAVPKADYQQQYYHSFKGNPEDTDDFALIGPEVDECVKFEPAGLRITLPIGHHGNQGTGLASHFSVQGDFEITLGFEFLQEPVPQRTGRATGLYLGVDLNTVSYNRATLTRGVRQERQFLTWFQLSTEGSDKPYRDELRAFAGTGLTGRLRLVRNGAVLAHYVAEGTRDFIFLREHPFGEQDVRAIRLGGQNGGPTASLDARIIDLRVRADSLPGMPEVPAAVREAGERMWLALAASLGTLIALSLTGALYLRRRRRVAPAPSPTSTDKYADGRNTAPASMSFSCSGCQNKLKARAELAGRSVKCPRCGQTVLIPSLQKEQ